MGLCQVRRGKKRCGGVLLKRTFGVDALLCETCGGRMELVAAIQEPEVIHKILDPLGLSARPAPAAPPWRPPRQPSLPAFDDSVDPPSGGE